MGGGKIRDADALPEDVRKGKVFYNNQGKQTGMLESNPWSDLKCFEITIPVYDYRKQQELPNGNDFMTTAEEDNPNYAPRHPSWGKAFEFKYTTKIAFKGQIKFVERLKTTKKYYIYSREFGSKGGGFGMDESNGKLLSIYHDGNYLYLCSYKEEYNGEKFRIWYRP